MTGHCRTCRCHESPQPVAVRLGDRIGNRLTGRIGIVTSIQQPNPPWHSGGTPWVETEEGFGSGYWHYYDLIAAAPTSVDVTRGNDA